MFKLCVELTNLADIVGDGVAYAARVFELEILSMGLTIKTGN